MEQIHGTHGTASVVEHPFLVGVDVTWMQLIELADNRRDNCMYIIGVVLQGLLGDLMELGRFEDVLALCGGWYREVVVVHSISVMYLAMAYKISSPYLMADAKEEGQGRNNKEEEEEFVHCVCVCDGWMGRRDEKQERAKGKEGDPKPGLP
jgi:hypothetical protein